MKVIVRCCAGLDVHKDSVWACVLTVDDDERVKKRVRSFGTTTHELRNLLGFLTAQGVTQVAMESTGVYWKPIWNVLEEGRFELLLCNAHHLKQVPGKKTDAKDCEWIAHLLQHGLLRGSFVPSRGLRDLRDLTRLRTTMTDEKSAVANRLQKILEDANIKLGSVASDVLSKSGRDMILALIGGVEDPQAIAELARKRMRGKIPQLRFALEGAVTEHHRFMLRVLYDQVLHLEQVLEQLDQRIADLVGTAPATPATASVNEPDQTLPLFPEDEGDPDGPKGQSEPSPLRVPHVEAPGADATAPVPSNVPPPGPAGGVRSSCQGLFPAAIALLDGIPGVGQRTAENILAEIGDDMSRFPTAGHLASWAGVCPGNNKSAGKQTKRKGKTTKGNRFLKRALNQAAWGAIRKKGTYFSAQYRRIKGRRGPKRAVVAVAHSLLVVIWHMLSTGESYRELGDDYFDRTNSDRLTAYHRRRLEKLGYSVQLEPKPVEADAAA